MDVISKMRCYYMQPTRPIDGVVKYHPCGHCIACKKNNATAWGIRSYFESLLYDNSVFLSLTYDDEHILPSKHPKYSGNLSVPHVQDFKKLFSYYCGSTRYIVGAEYGDETNRPHYHLICYGISLDNPVFYDKFYVPSKKAYIARCKAWKKGEVCVRPLDLASCFYTSKYTLKYKKSDILELKACGMQPPFRLMSKNPGIGYDYFLREKDRIFYDGYIRFKGSKISIPRYFYDKELPPGTQERISYDFNRSVMTDDYNDKEIIKKYQSCVGRDKQYKTWYQFFNALGEQQEYNIKERK